MKALPLAALLLSGCTTIQCTKGMDRWGNPSREQGSGCVIKVTRMGIPSQAQAEAIKAVLGAAQ